MKILVSILVLIIVAGVPKTMGFSPEHSAITGELNMVTLDKVENSIHEKVKTELKKNHKKSFTLNGYSIKTKIAEHRFSANVYEESFYEIQNPNNEFRMRLIVNLDGSKELAIFIQCNEELKNYHACFDSDGIFIEEDPWGKNKGNYSMEIFNVYKRYTELYTQKVDAKSYFVDL